MPAADSCSEDPATDSGNAWDEGSDFSLRIIVEVWGLSWPLSRDFQYQIAAQTRASIPTATPIPTPALAPWLRLLPLARKLSVIVAVVDAVVVDDEDGDLSKDIVGEAVAAAVDVVIGGVLSPPRPGAAIAVGSGTTSNVNVAVLGPVYARTGVIALLSVQPNEMAGSGSSLAVVLMKVTHAGFDAVL